METNIRPKLSRSIRRGLVLNTLLAIVKKHQMIRLDYRVNPEPRYGGVKPPHPRLYEIINSRRDDYRKVLCEFMEFSNEIRRIFDASTASDSFSKNTYMTGLDVVSLYGMIALHKPKRYMEVGSGNSTKLARRAITDQRLETTICSVDPFPRAEINALCDKVIRQPLEEIDLSIFSVLESGDILFIDNSHRCFMNSDVTVTFLEVLPMLKPGVLVHFHDIFLPYDYPQAWAYRFYSEQYVLGFGILSGGGNLYEIVCPNAFILHDEELRNTIASLLNLLCPTTNNDRGLPWGGSSFWIRMV